MGSDIMSYDPLIVFLMVDKTDAVRTNKELLDDTKKMQREANRIQNEVRKQNRNVMRTVYQGVATFNMVISALGVTLDPLMEASLNIAQQALMTIIQIHAILDAGTAGLGLVVSVGLVSAALLAYIATELMIMQKKEDAARAFRAAETAMTGIETMISIWI